MYLVLASLNDEAWIISNHGAPTRNFQELCTAHIAQWRSINIYTTAKISGAYGAQTFQRPVVREEGQPPPSAPPRVRPPPPSAPMCPCPDHFAQAHACQAIRRGTKRLLEGEPCARQPQAPPWVPILGVQGRARQGKAMGGRRCVHPSPSVPLQILNNLASANLKHLMQLQLLQKSVLCGRGHERATEGR